MDLALNHGEWFSKSGKKFHSSGSPYLPSREDRTEDVLTSNKWRDKRGRTLSPLKPPNEGGMTLEHILAVKAHLLAEHGAALVEGSMIWKTLCEGEKRHEYALQKVKDLNKDVIQW
jgi:hypothetical protein